MSLRPAWATWLDSVSKKKKIRANKSNTKKEWGCGIKRAKASSD
jgi:hypothetical protein